MGCDIGVVDGCYGMLLWSAVLVQQGERDGRRQVKILRMRRYMLAKSCVLGCTRV